MRRTHRPPIPARVDAPRSIGQCWLPERGGNDRKSLVEGLGTVQAAQDRPRLTAGRRRVRIAPFVPDCSLRI